MAVILFCRMKKKELKFYESRGTLEKHYLKVHCEYYLIEYTEKYIVLNYMSMYIVIVIM